MSNKSNPTELWSAALIGPTSRNELNEARKICYRWAGASMFRFFLVVAFMISFIISRYYFA